MPSEKSHEIPRPRLQLSATQLIASALAAVTATIAASYLGVNGTVIGAAIASLLTVTGNAVYSHSIHRTRERVRVVAPYAGRRIPAGPSRAEPVRPITSARPITSVRPETPVRLSTWRRAGFTAVGVFAAMLAVLTSVELVSGRPLSDLVRGKTGSGTTVFGSSQQSRPAAPQTPAPQTPLPQITVTQTVVPKIVTETPTVTQTAPTVTVTPSKPAASTPASPAPSATPTGVGTP